MFFALMIIDGIFKNNQAQVDEYLTALNPLLRRTTEGNFIFENIFKDLTPYTVPDRTSSLVSADLGSPKLRSSTTGQHDLSSLQNASMII
jgi:hypothetical protein